MSRLAYAALLAALLMAVVFLIDRHRKPGERLSDKFSSLDKVVDFELRLSNLVLMLIVVLFLLYGLVALLT